MVALDAKTGRPVPGFGRNDVVDLKQVGAIPMPAVQTGSPMTYMLNGMQHLVVSISGGTYSGELVAFKVPQETTTTAQLRWPFR